MLSDAKLEAIERHVKEVQSGASHFKSSALVALKKLANEDDANRAAIAQRLVGLLSGGSANDQKHAATALMNFAFRDTANSVAITAAGAIAPLVALVTNGTADCQERAVSALGNLAINNTANKVAIVAAGAFEALTALLENGSDPGKECAQRVLEKLGPLAEYVSRLQSEKASLQRRLDRYEGTGKIDMTQDDDGDDDAQRRDTGLREEYDRATQEHIVEVKKEKLDAEGARDRTDRVAAAASVAAATESERADFQGTNAMYLTAQKSELQKLVSEAARALIDADVPTHECPDNETPFYYMLESHRDDGKQTVPWNPEAGRAMTLAEGIAWLQNNPPAKRRRTRRPESDRDSLSSSNVPRRAAARRSARGPDRRGH